MQYKIGRKLKIGGELYTQVIKICEHRKVRLDMCNNLYCEDCFGRFKKIIDEKNKTVRTGHRVYY